MPPTSLISSLMPILRGLAQRPPISSAHGSVFQTFVRKFLRLIFGEPPFVKVVVARDRVFRSQLHTFEFERWINRVRKSGGGSAHCCRQESGGRDPVAKEPQKFAPAEVMRFRCDCAARDFPWATHLDLSHFHRL